ncbi:LacI family DNA-binding transcriptional regulator [Tichowtungia aerotolerans]|uniref:Substrate-binding domain-containing protein n=1 Tax=Tichowtungia aerotolerans TaxID=2697043 RepID=A0A6P1M560_9BACT|nr:LacI family DNA-binding transcriptional regulator [Tichowtungia aerotolerans]QHI69720.1 substrate-binding domain-containing protein [Tichowtungia aerotolerans]
MNKISTNLKNPTIKDVARVANCSIATVSCVLNNQGRIGKATKKRVLETCKKIGYYPSAAGKNLRTRTTETIGILFYPSCTEIFGNIFYSEVMEGLEETLTKANYNLLLAGYDLSTQHDDLPKFIREGYVDGTILMGGYSDDFKEKLNHTSIPFLMLDTDIAGVSLDSVTSDGFRAIMELTSYLYNQGHRRIIMFRHKFTNFNETARCMGFEAQIRQLGLSEEACKVIAVDTDEDAVNIILQNLKQKISATAVVTINDDQAFHIMKGLQEAGVNIPEQISITGYDDTDFAIKSDPMLTTIRIDRKRMGEEGAKIMLQRINTPDAPLSKLIIPFQLIERQSVRNCFNV